MSHSVGLIGASMISVDCDGDNDVRAWLYSRVPSRVSKRRVGRGAEKNQSSNLFLKSKERESERTLIF